MKIEIPSFRLIFRLTRCRQTATNLPEAKHIQPENRSVVLHLSVANHRSHVQHTGCQPISLCRFRGATAASVVFAAFR